MPKLKTHRYRVLEFLIGLHSYRIKVTTEGLTQGKEIQLKPLISVGVFFSCSLFVC